MPEEIKIVCDGCGHTTMTPRVDYDPPNAVVVHTNHCPDCDNGDFGSEYYLDKDGKMIEIE